ncbi:hypothetical protein ASZ78_013745, partial [Callipepla squamata]
TDDISEGDSIRSSEKADSNDSWHTSEEEELDFTPKKPQKPNLAVLMNAFQKLRNNGGGDGSKIKSPKSQKKSLGQKKTTGANLNKGERGELLNQDVSDSSNLEKDELEEEEEEEEDENDDGSEDEKYEEEEEDEKKEEDLEDKEAQSSDIMKEEQRGKIEPKSEINQKLGYLSNVKNEGGADCGAGNDSSNNQKICKKLDENMEESVDTPVSFIAGCCEKLQENTTATSPKRMNNEVSYKLVPKQAVLQNSNNLRDKQESCRKKGTIQEMFQRSKDSCLANPGRTAMKKPLPQPLSNSGDLQEENLSVSDGFKSNSSSWSASENLELENERPDSVLDDEDAEEEQCKQVDNKFHEALKQGSENLCLNRCEEQPRAAFTSSTKEEKPKREKEDTGEELHSAVFMDVKNSVCSNTYQVQDAANERSALPAVGAEQKEESESPWDSESDSGCLREVAPGVLLPAADEYGACLQNISGEHNNDLLEEFSLGDVDDIE